MRFLITGGFGYLGGRLAQYLSTQPINEILLGSRHQNESPLWLPHSKVVQTQWNSLESLSKICTRVDAIVHLAGMNAQDCIADPVAAFEFNAVCTGRLLQAAVEQEVKQFIYLSTAHVYTSPLEGLITENTCPTSLHPYASSHRAGEDMVRAARQRGEIDGIVIRLSNAYGAPAHKDVNCWQLLVNDLCRQVVTTKHMVVRSSGLQRRDFVPIEDVCCAIEHLLHLSEDSIVSDVFNVGGGWSPTVWEIACLVRDRCPEIIGFLPEITREQPQSGETSNELDYRSDALCQSGFHHVPNKVREINQLLEFCKASFS